MYTVDNKDLAGFEKDVDPIFTLIVFALKIQSAAVKTYKFEIIEPPQLFIAGLFANDT